MFKTDDKSLSQNEFKSQPKKNQKGAVSFSTWVPVRVMRSMICGCESISIMAISVRAAVWVRSGRRRGRDCLAVLLIVKQCHSQNSQPGAGYSETMKSLVLSHPLIFPVRPLTHFLTVIDKLDVFLVRCGETLFLLVVCGESRSWVMILLTVEAIENYLGCREADG